MVVLGNAAFSHPHTQPFCLSRGGGVGGWTSKNLLCVPSVHCLTVLCISLAL